MRRRDFVLVFAAVPASVRPLRPVRAQTTGLRRVGVVFQGGPYESSIAGLRDGLRAAGLEDGRHVTLLIRNAQGDMALAEAAARTLERDDRVEVIVAITTTAALAPSEQPWRFQSCLRPEPTRLRLGSSTAWQHLVDG